MLQQLQKKWNISARQLFWILCVFAITGLTTAYLTKVITSWVGFTDTTFWGWKLLLRLSMLLIGYQVVLLLVATLLGQFVFFWAYEKKILRWVGLLQKNTTTGDKKTGMRIAIFASGAGSNAAKIIDHFKNHSYINVALIVSNKRDAGVLTIARSANIPVMILEKERFFTGDAYLPDLKKYDFDVIVLAGFLWKVPPLLIQAFKNAIINIHPALLPKFGGKGMYGHYVHRAVLEKGEKESGITVHYVDEVYDHGATIFQATCKVNPNDTPHTLAQRVLALEHAHYPVVLQRLLEQKALFK